MEQKRRLLLQLLVVGVVAEVVQVCLCEVGWKGLLAEACSLCLALCEDRLEHGLLEGRVVLVEGSQDAVKVVVVELSPRRNCSLGLFT